MRIYDVLGNEKTSEWLALMWGVEVDRTLLREGQANFVLVELREMEGPSAYNVRVVDRNGAPFSGRFVGRYYPSAPNGWPGGTKPLDVPAPLEAYDHVVFGQTDANGQVQFGVGGGDYAGPGLGVTMFWIAEHYAGTDVVKRMGMAPNTNHRMLSPKFQYFPVAAEQPLPPTEDVPPVPPVPPVPTTNWMPILARGLRAMADALEQQVSR